MNDCFYRYEDLVIDLREVIAIRYRIIDKNNELGQIYPDIIGEYIEIHVHGHNFEIVTKTGNGRNLFEELNQKWQQIKGD